MAEFGLSPVDWWERVPLLWQEALHSYIPVLKAKEAMQGVSVARTSRLWGDAARKAQQPWEQILKNAETVSAPPPRYTHSLADEVADWASMGIAVRVF